MKKPNVKPIKKAFLIHLLQELIKEAQGYYKTESHRIKQWLREELKK